MRGAQIVHIEQEVEGDERTVLATVLATDFERCVISLECLVHPCLLFEAC